MATLGPMEWISAIVCGGTPIVGIYLVTAKAFATGVCYPSVELAAYTYVEFYFSGDATSLLPGTTVEFWRRGSLLGVGAWIDDDYGYESEATETEAAVCSESTPNGFTYAYWEFADFIGFNDMPDRLVLKDASAEVISDWTLGPSACYSASNYCTVSPFSQWGYREGRGLAGFSATP